MENNESWSRTDIVNIVALVLGTVFVLSKIGLEPIDMGFLPLDGMNGVMVNPFVALLVLLVLIGVLTVGLGAVLGFAYSRYDNNATAIKSSEKFQLISTDLEKYNKAKIDEWRQKRPTRTTPYYDLSYGPVVALGITVASLLAFSMPIFDAMLPTMKVSLTTSFAVAALVLVALVVKPADIDGVDRTDNDGIPWHLLSVALTGFLVVGLGIGLIVYYNFH